MQKDLYSEHCEKEMIAFRRNFKSIGQWPLYERGALEWEVPFEDKDFIWTQHIVPADTTQDSEGQTQQIFEQYEASLKATGLCVKDNCLRTWLFVRDIDNNYAGVVKGRRDYFDKIGLTKQTHYIASTGINGNDPDRKVLVSMDAFAVRGIDPGKVRHLKAPDHLNPTHEYGVTFERATLFEHNGHRRIFISGTASIDSKGEVIYEGNPSRQTERALENIRALLADGGAALSDVNEAIVYLRRPEDRDTVAQVLADKVPGWKCFMVHAPVCRPAWLVEIECIADISSLITRARGQAGR